MSNIGPLGLPMGPFARFLAANDALLECYEK